MITTFTAPPYYGMSYFPCSCPACGGKLNTFNGHLVCISRSFFLWSHKLGTPYEVVNGLL